MAIELVRVTTADGLWLDGAWQRPPVSDASMPPSFPIASSVAISNETVSTALPIDACLLVHGTGSNFYAPGVLETFAGQAAAAGVAVLRINTRGHDGISSIPGATRAVRGGATYEHVAECVFDLQAGLDFLAGKGYSRLALVGHSMGGVKSAYTLAQGVYPSVRALVMISSPRFHHAWYMGHPAAAAFREAFQRARLAVDRGQPDELIPMTQPMPFLATAAGILDKYGPADQYDWSRLLPDVQCPVLYVLGTESPRQSIGFDGVPEILKELAAAHAHVQFTLVDGANTNYSGQQTVPFERTWEWFQTLALHYESGENR